MTSSSQTSVAEAASNGPGADIAKHWIDGEWVGSDSVSESINPATGKPLGRWADGGEVEARAAITAARHAFETSPWSRDRALRNKALTRWRSASMRTRTSSGRW